ncbi:homocysteine S-methyltransferase family protein [Rhizomicrobium electricum]|uniref:Homocysteine S-methyltransferase family protein n=1 Tax=Rhizomicrobium electricum TaxID=480070 RepID=A0ABN1EE01_9PROT|nr:homocysteine S-methyltransferase family protein [Rhizomicrobium electricum]NIJ48695.1 methionine synthase I (cobalamin-dependent) [Rhizomicrobium electricum]
MSHPVIDKLIRQAPVITDGAWGTQLQARGLQPGDVPDLWNLSHPDAVQSVAAAYVAAGSQIILTNTFGANRFRLAEADAADKVEEINKAGVALSKQAAGEDALVFASIGPSGKLLLSGDVTEDDLAVGFAEQAEAIAAAKPDGIVIETMQDIQEAILAIAAAKATGLPVVASMVFDSGKDLDRTMMGATPEQAADALAKAGADVIGANCGQGIAGFVAICRRLKAASHSVPVWIKANAGLPRIENGKTVYATTADAFAAQVPAVLAAGASFIGGCCGTSPEFIAKVKATLTRA